MARQSCSACRKVIEVEPPVCPACRAAQPERAEGAGARVFARLGAAAAGALLAGGLVLFLRPPRIVSSVEPGPGAVALKARLDALKRDGKNPLTPIEDAIADPARYAGRRGTIVAALLNVNGRTAAIQGLGPLSNFELESDAALPSSAGRPWVVARGAWRRASPSQRCPLVFAAESVEPLGEATNTDIADVLGVRD
ncbi:MAG: hypothetical protein HY925_14540 [Elusimicrobia bacterium]|nr:hypothetical protein [Elusimicrobiota bacterium]